MDIQVIPDQALLELPEHSGESIRIDTPDSSGTTVTLEEAIAGWDVSVSTLRRRLADGAIHGAMKVPTKKGERWAIPIASLEALGYKRKGDTPSTPVGVPAGGREMALLEATVNDLREQLAGQRLALEVSTDREREQHQALMELGMRAAAAERELEVVRAELERERSLAEQARSQPVKRGLFRRGK